LVRSQVAGVVEVQESGSAASFRRITVAGHVALIGGCRDGSWSEDGATIAFLCVLQASIWESISFAAGQTDLDCHVCWVEVLLEVESAFIVGSFRVAAKRGVVGNC